MFEAMTILLAMAVVVTNPLALPPPLPPMPPLCQRCIDLEQQVAELTAEIVVLRKEVMLLQESATSFVPSDVGAGTSMKPAAGTATAPVLVRVPGTKLSGYGPYLTRKYRTTGPGQWWRTERCHGNYCEIEYYWVPKK